MYSSSRINNSFSEEEVELSTEALLGSGSKELGNCSWRNTQEEMAAYLTGIEQIVKNLRQVNKSKFSNEELGEMENELIEMVHELTDNQGIVKSVLTRLLKRM